MTPGCVLLSFGLHPKTYLAKRLFFLAFFSSYFVVIDFVVIEGWRHQTSLPLLPSSSRMDMDFATTVGYYSTLAA